MSTTKETQTISPFQGYIQTAVTIAVDVRWVLAQNGGYMCKGIYMFDNMISNGSSNEGQLELHTVCPVGSNIGFNIVPLDATANFGDSVVITGFQVSAGSVFTSKGSPQEYASPTQGAQGTYWVGQAMNAGSQTYQITGIATSNGVSAQFYWDPYITAQ